MRLTALALLAGLALGACSTTETAYDKDFDGLTDVSGKPIRHLNTWKIALHWAWGSSLWGDASLRSTVNDLSKAAKSQQAKVIRVVQSNTTYWWWVLPPISFLLSAQTANVAADVTP